jgi:ABC-type uncharacterized transport system involved in gliding motility auxiliary subunit
MRHLKKLLDLLAPLGVMLALGALAWSRTGRPLPGGLRPYLVAALALVLLHLVLRWEDVVRGLGRRQMMYGTNTVLLGIAVLGLLAAANYLAVRYPKRVDLTKNQRHSLSDQTRKALAALKDETTITYFDSRREMEAARDRLKEYEALSPKLKVEFVDPDRSPTRAAAYDARGPYPILFVEQKGKRERVTNTSEQDITNALIKVGREGKKTVCLLEGEGERSAAESGGRGFSGAKTSLTKGLYETKDVFLLREKTVPVDCTVLLVAGPEKDLLPETTAAIHDYVGRGGKAFVMIEAELGEAAYPNLVALLERWNIAVGRDLVVDRQGLSAFQPLVLDYPYHPITKDLSGVMTTYLGARTVEAGKGSVEGVTAQTLVQSSSASFAETDIAAALKGELAFDEKADRMGPLGLAAAATVKGKPPEPAPTPSPAPSPAPEEVKAPEGRVVAVGDVDFASNALLGTGGNQDFFLNAVAWLAEDADLISIRPKDPENHTLVLGPQAQQNVAWLALVILPGLFVLGGVLTWWKRR